MESPCDYWPIDTVEEASKYIEHVLAGHPGENVTPK